MILSFSEKSCYLICELKGPRSLKYTKKIANIYQNIYIQKISKYIQIYTNYIQQIKTNTSRRARPARPGGARPARPGGAPIWYAIFMCIYILYTV